MCLHAAAAAGGMWAARSIQRDGDAMQAIPDTLPVIDDELDVLAYLIPLEKRDIIELGCGAAHLARSLLNRFPDSRITGLEVDERQHAKNLALPLAGLSFVAGGAQAIPFADASFDVALMLKSLHHVPMPLLAQSLKEVGRVLRPRGRLYVSEPVYAGPFNELIRLFNDEGVVRAAAQAALDAALQTGRWEQVAEHRFQMPVIFKGFEDFEQRMMRPTFADHRIDEAKLAQVRAAFQPHLGAGGAHFLRPMHVRLLRLN
jgi:ubiquinone/menaquinone biosynthesis C-methylase UbiE